MPRRGLIPIIKVIPLSIALFLFFSSESVGQQENVEARLAPDASAKIVICSKVLEALGKISPPDAKEASLKGLDNGEFFIRAYAAQSLGRLKNNDKQAIQHLLKLLNDKSYLVRISAAKALFQLGETYMEETILNFLKDKDAAVRSYAVENAGELGEKYLTYLAGMLKAETDAHVRMKIIEQFGRNKFTPAVQDVRDALNDNDPFVRQAACFSLGNMGDRHSTSLLIDKLGDESPQVRSAAKEMVSKLHARDNPLKDAFWGEITDENIQLRISSFEALANLNDMNVVPVLLKEITLPDNLTLIRRRAARALVKMRENNPGLKYEINGNSLALVLVDALKNKQDPLYKDAVVVLKELNDKDALPALRLMLFDADPDMVASAAYALGELQDRDAVESLIVVFNKYAG